MDETTQGHVTVKKRKPIDGMVDISEKDVTKRVAKASSVIHLTPKAFKALLDGGSPKGDVFETAKIAGIMAAKSTSMIIPMCHPLALNAVKVTFRVEKSKRTVTTTAEVVCLGKTGVEMEALTAACVASLTIYDMMKWADKGSVISETKLAYKSGGTTGDYRA